MAGCLVSARAVFRLGFDGFRCGDCDAVCVEDDAGRTRHTEASEFWGARELRDEFTLSCPECGSEDLDEVKVCTECEEAEAVDEGKCTSCNPAQAEDFRRDQVEPVHALVRP